MPSRPCTFCLSLQECSVFADFDTDDDDHVLLLRISFDCFGCCSVDGMATTMNSTDSKTILDAVAKNHCETQEVRDIIRRYFKANAHIIWEDALRYHELL